MKKAKFYTRDVLQAPITEPPLFYPDEDLVVVIAGNTLSGYDTKHPPVEHQAMKRAWHVSALPGTPKGLRIADGVIYFVSGNQLFAYHLADGSSRWTFTSHGNAALQPPVALGDYLYLVDEQGALFKVRKLSGQADPQWGGVVRSGSVKFPPITNGRGLYYNVDGYMLGVDVISGKEVWLYDLSGEYTLEAYTPAYLVTPPQMDNQNSICCVMATSNKTVNKTVQDFVQITLDPDQLMSTSVVRAMMVYGSPKSSYHQVNFIGTSHGLFNSRFTGDTPLYGRIYDKSEVDGIPLLEKLLFVDPHDDDGYHMAPEFKAFADRHAGDAVYCSFLGDSTHVLLASGTELQPAGVVMVGVTQFDLVGMNHYLRCSEGYDLGLELTAPPALDAKGMLYATGRDPSNGKYYLDRFTNLDLTP